MDIYRQRSKLDNVLGSVRPSVCLSDLSRLHVEANINVQGDWESTKCSYLHQTDGQTDRRKLSSALSRCFAKATWKIIMIWSIIMIILTSIFPGHELYI